MVSMFSLLQRRLLRDSAANSYYRLRNLSIKFPAKSWFFPKKTRKALEKTKYLGADVVVLDLEDSVAEGEKFKVREEYTRALDDGAFSGQRVFVRVSDLESPAEVEEDLRALCRPEIFGFLLPKVRHPDQVRQIDAILTSVEKRNGLSTQTKKFAFAC